MSMAVSGKVEDEGRTKWSRVAGFQVCRRAFRDKAQSATCGGKSLPVGTRSPGDCADSCRQAQYAGVPARQGLLREKSADLNRRQCCINDAQPFIDDGVAGGQRYQDADDIAVSAA